MNTGDLRMDVYVSVFTPSELRLFALTNFAKWKKWLVVTLLQVRILHSGLSNLLDTFLVREIFPAFRCQNYRTLSTRCQTYRTLCLGERFLLIFDVIIIGQFSGHFILTRKCPISMKPKSRKNLSHKKNFL